ncbi:MAG: hypothetical protein JJ992_09605, partial [Planctomycetes bacterium]|nr:hypothetical protein [Planctomycetota bacterium]
MSWAMEQSNASDATRQLISRLECWYEKPSKSRNSKVVGLLERWLTDSESRRAEAAFGLEMLAWTYALPRLAAMLPAAPWCEVLDYLIHAATDWPDLGLEQDPLSHQWLAGELPLTLAYQFPELPACRGLKTPAAKALSAGLKSLLDGNGLPSADHLHLVRPLLACWTRCCALGAGESAPVYDEQARTHFDWFVRRAVQLTRETGSPVFSNGSFDPLDEELFDVAVGLVGDSDDAAIADQILPGRSARRLKIGTRFLFPE